MAKQFAVNACSFAQFIVFLASFFCQTWWLSAIALFLSALALYLEPDCANVVSLLLAIVEPFCPASICLVLDAMDLVLATIELI